MHAQPCPSSVSFIDVLCLCGLRPCHEAINKVSLLRASSVPAEFLVWAALDTQELWKTSNVITILLSPEPAHGCVPWSSATLRSGSGFRVCCLHSLLFLREFYPPALHRVWARDDGTGFVQALGFSPAPHQDSN